MELSSAVLRGIWRTFSIRRCFYPLFIRCVVSALERVLKNSSFSNFTFDINGFHLKKQEIIQYDF